MVLTARQRVPVALRPGAVRFETGWTLGVLAGYCPLHRHATLEIVYHASGRGRSRLANGGVLEFGPGDVVIYAPKQAHDQTNDTRGEDRCVHLHAPRLAAADLPADVLRDLGDAYAVRELVALSEARLAADALAQASLHHRAAALLARLLHLHREQTRRGAIDPATRYAEFAHAHIAQHAGRIRSLSEVAQRVGVSGDYLRHVFRHRYGQSIKQWHAQSRLELARNLLVFSSLPVKSVARQCGFATDRHFCTAFRARVGVTPLQYRRSALAAADV